MKRMISLGAIAGMLGLWPGLGLAIPLQLDVSTNTSTADTLASVDDLFTTTNPDSIEIGPLVSETNLTGSTQASASSLATYSDTVAAGPRDGQVQVNSLALVTVRPADIRFRMRAHNSGSTVNNRDPLDVSLVGRAEASAFGEAEFVVQSGGSAGSGSPVVLSLAPLLGNGPDGTHADVFIRINNISRGNVLIFDSDLSGLPGGGILIRGANVGDELKLTFRADLFSTFAGEVLGGFGGITESQDWILQAEADTVPAPAASALLGIALLGFVIVGRRRIMASLAATSLVLLALSPSVAQAEDADYLLDLIPGSVLSEEELAQYYGRGVSLSGLTSFSSGSGFSGAGTSFEVESEGFLELSLSIEGQIDIEALIESSTAGSLSAIAEHLDRVNLQLEALHELIGIR